MAKAAHAFFLFLSETVEPKTVSRADSPPDQTPCSGPEYSLHSLLIGDLHGSCSMVFTRFEYDYIRERLSETFGLHDDETIQDCLIEMMNIIGTNVISELSDALGLRIFLDVAAFSKSGPVQCPLERTRPCKHQLHRFSSVLTSTMNSNFSPLLVCCLNSGGLLAYRPLLSAIPEPVSH